MDNETTPAGIPNRKRGMMPIVIAIIVIVAALGYAAYAMGWLSGGNGKTVATVNGEKVTERDVDIRVNQLRQAYEQQGIDLSDPAKLKDAKLQVVNEIVNEDLVLAEAAKQGITVTDDEVATSVQAVETQAGGTDKLDANLKQFGMTRDDLKELVKRNLILQKFVDQYATSQNVTVSDQEAAEAYKQATAGSESTSTPTYQNLTQDQKANVMALLRNQKVAQKVTELINQLKQNADIKIMI